MKRLKNGVLLLLTAFYAGCDTPFLITTSFGDTNPPWAPPYYNGARYYYFPDEEMYYDLSGHQFVYLNNGQWLFTPTVPAVYSHTDLYNSFIITLNITVYQPWMHHQYYVSHYPRYYYHNVYGGNRYPDLRGFNENERKPIFWQPGERERINELRRNPPPPPKPAVQPPPQKTNYYGKPIGQPVKVKPNMRLGDILKQKKVVKKD
ncbi:MAG TPA: hypothetical protein VFV31_04755 [Chitinophagaceae bacterium]|nr:hypothetical protein [Chitinophagaceae bacterium]